MCSPQVMAQVREQLHSDRQSLGRRRFIGATAALAAFPLLPAATGAQDATPVSNGATLNIGTIADLTHVTTATFPVFPGNEPFAMEQTRSYADDGYYANQLTLNEHTGTHVDAPAHLMEGAETAELLSLERFFAPLAVVDISARAAEDEDAVLSVDDLMAWEAEHGELPAGAFVALYSGWEARLSDPDSFVNVDPEGVQHYPGFEPDAAAFLVEERDIVGIGVDTLSLDPGNAAIFESHVTVLGAGKYGVEALANLAKVPPAGATVIVGGPKHENASGGPCRVYAVY